ncbi:MAG: OprO/OprP family phosphate-selective porin [Clostridium sp.]|nr:OprO/OprP family phosphate-selective porin [Prevotella sp.]MCM1428389.1 OprO/OprP family phosphate-selective porin [Clostridium sp.]
MRKLHIYLATAITLISFNANAAQTAVGDSLQREPKLSIKPCGRLLMDGALYSSPQKDMFKDGVAIPDVRLGAKLDYGNWKAVIEVGYAYNKVGLKDLYMEYDFNSHNLIRIGSFIHQYGLQSSTGASMKITMEEPVSNAIFNDPRQLGVMFIHSAKNYFVTASAHAEPSATTVILRPQQYTQEGYGFRSRLVGRPIAENGRVAQIGFSAGFATPQRTGDPDIHNAFQLKADYPTKVSQVTALDATVSDARNMWKFTPEILLNYGPVALESQYYWTRISRRHNLYHFTGQGAYVFLRGLILGGDYSYSPMIAALATPKPKSLEAVVGYNYTDVTSAKAGIYGGRLNNFTLTFNYYINKYMLCRLHYSYTHTWGRRDASGEVPSVSVNGFMARLQVLF